MLFAGRAGQALHSFERTRELAPNTFVPHLFIALAHAQAGELIAARESLQRAVRLNPRGVSDTDVLMTRATIFQIAGREDEAVKIREQLRAENPDAINPRLSLAVHDQVAGRHDETRAFIRPDPEEYFRTLRAAGLP